ncbi:MAG: patatin-like phospholipase family protein [Rhodoferax sp.]|nr:patatin-like phospholipase family protein [Rhodoferax sp.]
MKRQISHPPKIALALAGGGPLGAIYEIGALCALEESLQGIDFTKLQHYVGVSAGAFVAAGLANGISPRELCASFIEGTNDASDTFDPSWLMAPAYGEFARRSIMLPGLLVNALWHYTVGKNHLHTLGAHGAQPADRGVQQCPHEHQIGTTLRTGGRTNDFRQLKTQLTLVATNLDSGEPAPFGRPGWDHVPISKAVQASAALPGMFPPVEIDDSYYVDGALKKTMHASVALDEGVDLMLCLNPLVPFDATAPQVANVMLRGLPPEKRFIPRIVDGGLTSVLSQTFRSIIHSRLVLGMKQYERLYPETDIILIEPDHRDPELYLTNTFSYAQRHHLAEHAYQQTRMMLRSQKTGLSAKLAGHGISLNHKVLNDPKRFLDSPGTAHHRVGPGDRKAARRHV